MALQLGQVQEFLRLCVKLGLDNIPTNVTDDFYTALIDYTYFYVHARVRNTTQAQDLTGKIMLKVIKELKKGCEFKTAKHFLKWLHVVADRVIIDFRRSRWNLVDFFGELFKKRKSKKGSDAKDMPGLPTIETLQDSESDTETSAIVQAKLDALMQELSPQEQHMLVLKYYYGYTYEQMAQILGVRASALRKRVSRLVKRLKEQIGGGHNTN